MPTSSLQLLPLLQRFSIHNQTSSLPRLAPHSPGEDHPALQHSRLRAPPRHPAVRVVVRVSPRARRQRSRRLVQRLDRLRDELPSGDRVRGVVQQDAVARDRIRGGGGREGDV